MCESLDAAMAVLTYAFGILVCTIAALLVVAGVVLSRGKQKEKDDA